MTQFLLTNFGEARLTEPVAEDDTVFRIDPIYSDRFPAPVGDQAFALILWDGTQPQEICYCYSNPMDGYLQVTRGEEATTPRAWLAGTMVRHFLTAETAGALFQTEFIATNKASKAEAEAGVAEDVVMTPLATDQYFDAHSTPWSQGFLKSDDAFEGRQALGWYTAVFSGTGLETVFPLPDPLYNSPYTKVYVNEVYQSTGYTLTDTQITFTAAPPLGTDNIVISGSSNFAFSVSFPGTNTVGTTALVDNAVTNPKLAANSVSTAKIQAKAVTYARMQDVSSTDRILGRFSAGAGGIEELLITDAAQQFLSAPDTAALQASMTNSLWPMPTGTILFMIRADVPTGWIQAYGGSIGNSGSGANRRANADTMNLFAQWWSATSGADYPLYGPGGFTVVSKQATWQADWNANRHIAIMDLRASFLRAVDAGAGIDTGRGNGGFQAFATQQHYHTLVMNALPAHGHSYGPVPGNYGMNGQTYGQFQAGSGDSNRGSYTLNTTQVSAGTPSGYADWMSSIAGQQTAAETRPRNLTAIPFIKL